ncbi:MAG TPA: RNA polymerase sigma factor [Candidatus Dormibacteraeota bacterium]|nr:RNA polymerase sigma factor [Candidatus Dormibacteraeota bacterium]
MFQQRSEEDLIRSARDGDGGAFADLLRPLYSSAFRVALALLHDRGEAEDAVQEAAFKAWRKLGTVRRGAPLRPWFLAIVANQCRSVRRKSWWSPERLEERLADFRVADADARIDLHQALKDLDYDQRLVLVLRYYLDLPYEEIAQVMGISAKAARSRNERAIRRLRPIFPLTEAVI